MFAAALSLFNEHEVLTTLTQPATSLDSRMDCNRNTRFSESGDPLTDGNKNKV